MDQYHRLRRAKALWVMALLGTAYAGALRYLAISAALDTPVGVLGVLLGLYVCSHPAANAVDTLFDRDALGYLATPQGIGWLALNLLVTLAGLLAIFLGAMRLGRGAP